MAIDGAKITSDLLPARPRLFSAAHAARGALNLAADLLLPPVCISCRKRAGAHGLLCGDCWPKIDFIAPPRCIRLGIPLPYDTGEPSLSAAAIADPPVYDRARAAARYSSTMRDPDPELQIWGSPRGRAPVRAVDGDGGCRAARRRQHHRAGSALPLEALVAALSVGHARPGGRQADRRSRRLLPARKGQAHSEPGGLTAAQRRKNVAGAFRVTAAKGALREKRIVVVDDVITTGATAEACARVLKRAGVARVDVLALARAVEPSALLL